MHTQIALFNHKGGVSKTTTSFNLGWMLASRGKRVLLVDSDPQCNLSTLVLGFTGHDEMERFYEDEPERNLRAGLAPAFESQPRRVEAVAPVEVDHRSGLYLLPGHIRLSEYEVTLGIAQELSNSLQALRNVPGALSYLIGKTAESVAADYILVDMNPSLSAINQNLLMTSDYFVVPMAPDYFSLMAADSLRRIIPRWQDWARRAASLAVLQNADYPFPEKTPRLLGTIIQNYRPRGGAPTHGFRRLISDINELVSERLVPEFSEAGLALDASRYSRIDGFTGDYCLALVPDFNTLVTTSQQEKTPVFALSDEQLGQRGQVLETNRLKVQDFQRIFEQIAERIETLMAVDDGASGS